MFKHKIIVSAVITAVLFVNGCSWSPPKTVYPDGSERVPANSLQKTTELQTARERNRSMLSENDALRAQMAMMQKQIEAILAAVSGVMALSADPKQPPAQVPQRAPAPVPSDSDGAAIQRQNNSLLPEIDTSWYPAQNGWTAKNAVQFTKTFATGDANISLSKANTSMLYRVGSLAETIEVRGCTDSRIADAANKRVATQRALNARTMLVGMGIDADKIRTRISPSGNFVAPTNTEEGRAKNRRVDILFYANI